MKHLITIFIACLCLSLTHCGGDAEGGENPEPENGAQPQPGERATAPVPGVYTGISKVPVWNVTISVNGSGENWVIVFEEADKSLCSSFTGISSTGQPKGKKDSGIIGGSGTSAGYSFDAVGNLHSASVGSTSLILSGPSGAPASADDLKKKCN